MLEVQIDIVPFGYQADRETIGKLRIINTGDHIDRPNYGNYICEHPDGSFKVLNHKRSDGVWLLLKKCIEEYISV